MTEEHKKYTHTLSLFTDSGNMKVHASSVDKDVNPFDDLVSWFHDTGPNRTETLYLTHRGEHGNTSLHLARSSLKMFTIEVN